MRQKIYNFSEEYFAVDENQYIFAVANGGIAQLARASALQAEGRRFDSDYLHYFFFIVLASVWVIRRCFFYQHAIGRFIFSIMKKTFAIIAITLSISTMSFAHKKGEN